MCHWFWVSLAHVTNYCSGKTGCQVTAGEGVALASSDHAAFKVEIGRTYSFLLDARTSDTLKTCTIKGADVDPIVERDTALDPWTLTAFKVEAKLTATEDIIRISGQGRGRWCVNEQSKIPNSMMKIHLNMHRPTILKREGWFVLQQWARAAHKCAGTFRSTSLSVILPYFFVLYYQHFFCLVSSTNFFCLVSSTIFFSCIINNFFLLYHQLFFFLFPPKKNFITKLERQPHHPPLDPSVPSSRRGVQ